MFSIVRSTEEYIDALETPGTWMSTIDISYFADFIKTKIVLLNLMNDDSVFSPDNFRIRVFGPAYPKTIIIRYISEI